MWDTNWFPSTFITLQRSRVRENAEMRRPRVKELSRTRLQRSRVRENAEITGTLLIALWMAPLQRSRVRENAEMMPILSAQKLEL